MIVYVVMPRDSVYSIAAEYGLSAEKIIADNRLRNGGQLAVGQTLVLQFPLQTHTVAAGESLFTVAQEYGTTADALLRNNPELNGKAVIYPGQVLTISLKAERQGEISVSGYAYPHIPREQLRQVLPYLTYLTVFTYGVSARGDLIAPDDGPLIRMAKEYGVAPILNISSVNEEGYFDNSIFSTLLTDQAAQRNLIKQVTQAMTQKGYRGVDMDFEYLPAEYAQAYVGLVRQMRAAVHALGGELTVALAPKTSATQPGLLYEGHLYKELGEAADHVLLMTYEWGYTYGPPMAVAPIDKVEEVVKYALSEIPAGKIRMGIPTYGYDWTLPYLQGRAARSLSAQEAMELAVLHRAEIHYDHTAQAPYFYYREGEEAHVVWFEDARSMQEKLILSDAYRLDGIAFWSLMRPFPQGYAVLNGMEEIRAAPNVL